MFGLFKKAFGSADVDLNDFVVEAEPQFDIPDMRDPSDPTSVWTEYDLENMREYPFVAAFVERYPLTRLDTNQLAIVYMNARDEIKSADEFSWAFANKPVSDRPIEDRIMELAWEKGIADHELEVAERADLLAFSQQLDDELAMVELREAVEDNNPVTMAARAINAHPFLAGWFSVDVTNRLKQK